MATLPTTTPDEFLLSIQAAIGREFRSGLITVISVEHDSYMRGPYPTYRFTFQLGEPLIELAGISNRILLLQIAVPHSWADTVVDDRSTLIANRVILGLINALPRDALAFARNREETRRNTYYNRSQNQDTIIRTMNTDDTTRGPLLSASHLIRAREDSSFLSQVMGYTPIIEGLTSGISSPTIPPREIRDYTNEFRATEGAPITATPAITSDATLTGRVSLADTTASPYITDSVVDSYIRAVQRSNTLASTGTARVVDRSYLSPDFSSGIASRNPSQTRLRTSDFDGDSLSFHGGVKASKQYLDPTSIDEIIKKLVESMSIETVLSLDGTEISSVTKITFTLSDSKTIVAESLGDSIDLENLINE